MVNRVMITQVWDDFAQGSLIILQGSLALLRDSLAVVGLLAALLLGYVIHNDGARQQALAFWPFQQDGEIANAAEVESLAEAVREPALKATSLLGLEDAPSSESPTLSLNKEQEAVAKYLAKRYRINKAATDILVEAAWNAGKETALDPLLILAVTAIESRFNPFAESSMGAQGLMQVMSRVHQDKLADFGGKQAALNPVTNIKVGALVLKDCVKRGGSLEAGLKLYLGAVIANEGSYLERVNNEHERLKLVAKGKAPVIQTPLPVAQPSREPKPEPLDQLAALG
ncbi:lytic transglycosylase domain-containing protein [Parvibium lacunae]|uniref:Transglycosylase SLT domain-containing protein n=1 Tax=Parvibium lacunae TaxID=1888893 RepID=A0A368L1W5_9BURK|nr:lytic transglycosylase domain-containing protein [Parvibium lacunae]RCS57473.1 hypothetical protein DU000_08450 [Parvibium lacunae]